MCNMEIYVVNMLYKLLTTYKNNSVFILTFKFTEKIFYIINLQLKFQICDIMIIKHFILLTNNVLYYNKNNLLLLLLFNSNY